MLAGLFLRNKDGSESKLILFKPWGHYKEDDKYWTTDLGALKEAIQGAVDSLQESILKEENK
jgi:hypothetical protein